jgi:hypothetical protein
MRKLVFLMFLSLLLVGCNAKPRVEKEEKAAVKEETQPDPYQQNADDSEESRDAQKGYYDPLRGVKDVRKQAEEEIQKEKEAQGEADNQTDNQSQNPDSDQDQNKPQMNTDKHR